MRCTATGGAEMSIRKFTPEEVSELSKNPAVLRVNEHFLHLTPEFKEWFYREFKRGMHAPQILRDAGFNLDVLTPARVRSIRAHILQWKAEQPKPKETETELPCLYELAAAKQKIDRLERQLKRTTQELEFVKKILAAGREI